MLKYSSGASIGALAIALAAPAAAQTTEAEAAAPRVGGVDTIFVTATKRTEDLQDVPVSVQALGTEQLEELNIDTFDDYLNQLPTVTAGGSGPGQSTIYIRGLASTTPSLTTAGVAGLAPNVSMYLDEQPLAQPGRNLDVYAADLSRIEVLSGPQGTLFGASSQAGVVRLITNKPSLAGFDASASAGVSFTKGGEASYKAEVMLNVPVADTLAVRGVAFVDNQGGYIDNVAGTRTVRESARFRSAGTVRSNGTVVTGAYADGGRGGIQAAAARNGELDDGDVNFIAADNSGLVEENFNDATYAGFRASALWEITPDWTLNVSHMRQRLETDGVFFADPELDGLDDLQIQRFEPDHLDDEFSNTSWTVEGRLAMLDVVYTGAYTDRETQQRIDYSDYLFVGQYLPYYICDGSVSYPGAGGPSGTCQAPNLYVTSASKTTTLTQELRFSTPDDFWIRATAGGFYSDLELKERNDFAYPGNIQAQPFGPFAPNYPQPGYNSDPGPFPAATIFRNDIRRTDKQLGIFGEASIDLMPDLVTVTFGARYYDVEVDFEGSANGSFCNSGAAEDANAYGTDLNDLYDGDGEYTFINSCNAALRQTFTLADSLQDIMDAGLNASQAQQVYNAVRAPDKAKTDGFIYKASIQLTPTPDTLVYATYSEGFRPGLLNRPGGATNGSGYTVPFELETDEVKNYEVGWKLDLVDGQVRFNGSAFFVDIERLQTTIFDPAIVNLFFSDNAADAEIYGVEGDFTVAPYALPGFTFSGAFSVLDTKITNVLVPTEDVKAGEPLAYAPKFQGNARIRYEWDLSNSLEAYVQPQVTYSSSKYTDIIEINKLQLGSYTIADLSVGVVADQWRFEVYGENVFDERAEISGSYVFDRPRVTTNRPRTIGMRMSYNY
tara:strand:- start:12592 stop:15273 length:2682 start_codon:yes stop_codon:yes gene_type:complete